MNNHPTCIYCNRGEQERPLLQFAYRGWHYWICPEHLPVLIHHPEQLTEKLAGYEPFTRFEENV